MVRPLFFLALFSCPYWPYAQSIQPVSFADVVLLDSFWKPRVEKVAAVTVPVCIQYTEEKTGRIRNFEKAARKQGEAHEGIFYDDSDVYKALEAMAYALKLRPDPVLEAKADEWIAKIAAAQQPDGYLNTFYTLTGLDHRWTDMAMHEDYCAGHLIEAAVAYRDATGKRQLLDVAIRMADHMLANFGPGKAHWVTGHEELELALVKLYRVTGERKYLDFAGWLLEERGRGHGVGYTWRDWKDTAYCQDNVPVRQASEITGHAVRAMYLYTGAADVAAHTRDTGYLLAMQRVWEDVVGRNMYCTGGIGSSGRNEGFTIDYDLPNEAAYCETCASVGMVFWNQRMFQLTGESKYVDVLERSLYNGALAGLSLTGDRFFYGNPLASTGQHNRREWFGTACCPSNIARLVASVGNYMYAYDDKSIWVNLYANSKAQIPIGGTRVTVLQDNTYPWNGKMRVHIQMEKPKRFALRLRQPGWLLAQPVPEGLYQNLEPDFVVISPNRIRVSERWAECRLEKGYIVIEREWRPGDWVELDFPMDVVKLVSREEVEANRQRVALQRGPLVYCFEGADNQGKAHNFILPETAIFQEKWQPDLLGGIVTLSADLPVVQAGADGQSVQVVQRPVTAIPYHAWCNRGPNPMQVWVPRRIGEVRVLPEEEKKK
jgi:DUF1680 family protein